jgi:hypothetical protein
MEKVNAVHSLSRTSLRSDATAAAHRGNVFILHCPNIRQGQFYQSLRLT